MTPQLAIDDLRAAILRLPPGALSDGRTAALAKLQHAGLPSVRHEDWKYTDLGAAIKTSNAWLAAGARNTATDSLADSVASLTASIEANWLVIANGDVNLSHFDTTAGIDIELFSASHAPTTSDKPLADFNAALLSDGIRVRIHAATEKPLAILVVDEASNGPTVSQANIEIEVAPGCDAEIIEYQSSAGDGDCYCNSIVALQVGASASVGLVRIQARDIGHAQTARLSVVLGADSQLQMSAYDLGGGLIRNDVDIEINEIGATASFNGLYLAGDGQHIDNHTRVDHRVGPAFSSQEYRGILNGRSRCVWNGKAVVHRGADGTDANQANHNLLLSDKAEIDAKPELEIYADDVKCSHGTTVGQLDEAALYYLRTRGLGRREATQILTHAFAADLVGRAPIAAAQDAVSRLVEARLADLIEEPGS